MAEKSSAQKMHIKPGMSVALVNAPDGLALLLGLPEGALFGDAVAGASVVLGFGTTQAQAEELLAGIVAEAAPSAVIWFAYPKGSKAAGYDISRDTLWPFAETLEFRPASMISIDATWSAMRFARG